MKETKITTTPVQENSEASTPKTVAKNKVKRVRKKSLEELYATNLNKLNPEELKTLVKDLSKKVETAENAFESFKNSAESAFKEANYFRELYTKAAGRNAGALAFIKQEVAALHKVIDLTERELNRDGN